MALTLCRLRYINDVNNLAGLFLFINSFFILFYFLFIFYFFFFFFGGGGS